ncbi:MAG TPA: DNA replication and repair protein RecF [Dehalococcoidia bacterium]|nr:DNA replication and repair protein RecF [Dehalococcoidia bacterium]
MKLERLQLVNFRNFRRLDLSFGPGGHLLLGDNAQGKTNLLEAVYLLSTLRAFRAESDAQLVNREAQAEGLPAARIAAEVRGAAGPLRLEVVVSLRESPTGSQATKAARVNGVPRRLHEAVGLFLAVLFTVQDLELLEGPPALRRRYLDTVLGQVDRGYLLARQRLEKVLLQRNHLLRRIREGAARRDELDFWDEVLAQDAATMVWARAQAVAELAELAASAHVDLAGGDHLGIVYRPRLGVQGMEALGQSPEALASAILADLRRHLAQDIAAGATTIGPHRDDLEFVLGGLPAAGYASRAQQRTIALALRLAEAALLRQRRGEAPVLLLDDVLSEMDAGRRRRVVAAIAGYEQVLVTAAEMDAFPPEFLARARLYLVAGGQVTPALDAATTRTGDS